MFQIFLHSIIILYGGLYASVGENFELGSSISGLIDDVRICDEELSAGEIAALAQWAKRKSDRMCNMVKGLVDDGAAGPSSLLFLHRPLNTMRAR